MEDNIKGTMPNNAKWVAEEDDSLVSPMPNLEGGEGDAEAAKSDEAAKPLNYAHFPLQFITNGRTGDECVEQAKRVLDGGCLWVQLRMKNGALDTAGRAAMTDEEFLADVTKTAEKLKMLTDSYGATLIIDDFVDVAKRVGATGVHLGKNDMNPSEARSILGPKFVIGGTCNTFDDILAVKDSVDYIGCGPFRYTQTKKNLAPVLGLDGYRELIWQCRCEGINIPMVAIGGITLADIKDIILSGPEGIALSGEIISAQDPEEKTRQVVEEINRARG